jgi:hypothetical protein
MGKRIVLAAVCLAFVCSAAMWATETTTSDLYYINVPIVRVLQHRDGYVVYYQKKAQGIGKTYIPKKWFAKTERKAYLDPLDGYMGSFLTIYYNQGEFQRVRLNLPTDPRHAVWGGVYNGNDGAELFDIDTIDIVY